MFNMTAKQHLNKQVLQLQQFIQLSLQHLQHEQAFHAMRDIQHARATLELIQKQLQK